MTDTLPSPDRERLRRVLARGAEALIGLQRDDGHFCGELEGDSILESEYLLMKFILGQDREPMADGAPGPEKIEKIAQRLRSLQRSDGGWGQFPGSDVDLSATVKAYFALKLIGDDPNEQHLRDARAIIRDRGGAEGCNSFSNFYLACLGQVSWNAVPAIPPEIMYLPAWSYFNLRNVSAWTRTMIVPLSLVVTLRPTRRIEPGRGIDELYLDERKRHRLTATVDAPPAWAVFFASIDRMLKVLQAVGGTPVRRLALRRAEAWLLERAGGDGGRRSEGLGAIFPPMVYLQIALHALGYRRDHPVIRRAERDLDALFIEENGAIRIQPCFSPVWDTGIALYALADGGLDGDDEPLRRAARWLRGRECRLLGDWAGNLEHPVEPSGWWFEYRNPWYPDVDDTAMVAMALRRVGDAESVAAAERGVRWMLALQNRDGGWAAFDRTRHRRVLEYIPFADHNALQDPSCPDITGRVLECLAWHGLSAQAPAVTRAIEFVRSRQEPEGCFFGRWGVNYIYGTWQAVVGPIRCGVSRDEAWIRRAGTWIKSIQKADGSFGETANSYEDRALNGCGPSTASQTAWAAMVLQEIYGRDDLDLRRAIEWLAGTQLTGAEAERRETNPDGDPPGSWVEREFTGTGFPRVFYLRYHLYRLYFPVMAIGRYLGAHGVTLRTEPTVKMRPKLVPSLHEA